MNSGLYWHLGGYWLEAASAEPPVHFPTGWELLWQRPSFISTLARLDLDLLSIVLLSHPDPEGGLLAYYTIQCILYTNPSIRLNTHFD